MYIVSVMFRCNIELCLVPGNQQESDKMIRAAFHPKKKDILVTITRNRMNLWRILGTAAPVDASATIAMNTSPLVGSLDCQNEVYMYILLIYC